MKKSNQNYFASQLRESMEDHNSFDEDLYIGGGNPDWNADWNANGGDAPTSQPYIVTLENSTGADVNNVNFLHPASALRNGAVNFGIPAGIVPTYGISGLSYEDFLATIQTQAVKIGTTEIQSANSTQLLETIKIEVNNAMGSGSYSTFNPRISPYQQQNSVVIMPDKFILSNFTKLTINKIAKNTVVTFRFYPMAVTSSVSGLTGKETNQYSKPNFTAGAPVITQ